MKASINIYITIAIILFAYINVNLVEIPVVSTDTKIIAGYQHSVILHNQSIWFMGKRRTYDNQMKVLDTPTLTKNISEIIGISSGSQAKHILVIKSDSSVWAWGNNSFGQLSVFPSTYEAFPLKVENLQKVINVSTGKNFSTALKADGTVWTWGNNKNGQLGINHTENQIIPKQVKSLSEITAISAGAKHTLALKADGTVWAWGNNNMGQLGIGNFENQTQPKMISNLTNIVKIVAGSYHNFAMDKDGKVYAWGWNKYGQIGDYSFKNVNKPVKLFIKNVKTIEAGTLHSIALKNDGTVWGWGSNSFNQLGELNKKMIEYPLQIIELKNINSISAGDMHNLALDFHGKVWAWGASDDGRFGNGNKEIKSVPDIALSVLDLTKTLAKKEVFFANFNESSTPKITATLKVYGLEKHKSNTHFEIPVNNYVIDTMYHTIQIGDIVVEGCPTEQALKKLDVQLKSDIDGNTLLSWDLNENDFYYDNYFVEKSIDGFNWKELNGEIDIKERKGWTTFSIIDNNNINQHRFYRLKHLNCDEEYVYSNIINTISDDMDGIFKSKFTVSIDNPSAKSITYQIQDRKGNIIKKKILNDRKIAFTDGWDLAVGTYYMFLIDEKLHHIMDVKKLVKIN